MLERIVSTWGAMFGSSALHTQTTALGEGIKQCTVGRPTMVTITTRDWQVSLLFVYSFLETRARTRARSAKSKSHKKPSFYFHRAT